MSKKDLNFEINILPILDILSVLICFLLLTAVWVQLSAIEVKQAVGDNAQAAKNPPSIWTTVGNDGSVRISLRDVQTKLPREMHVAAKAGAVDIARLSSAFKTIKAQIPDLRTGIVRAQARTGYGDVVQIMDELRRSEIVDIGLTPLAQEGVL